MINSPKRSIRLKNKRLLAKVDLKNDADTVPPLSADFNINRTISLAQSYKP